MKDDAFSRLYSGEPGATLGMATVSVLFPVLAILLGALGDAISSFLMIQTNTYFLQPIAGILGAILGFLALRNARRLRRSTDDVRLRVSDIVAVVGIVLLPAYLLIFG